MILVTHSVIGASLAHRFTSAAAAFVVGLISHYVSDMIPHWHYPVPEIVRAAEKPPGTKALTVNMVLFPELIRVSIDLVLGIGLALFLFKGSPLVVFFAAFGAVLPDLLVGLAKFYPQKILVWHDIIHRKVHTRIRLDDRHFLGIGSQAAIAFLLAWLFL